MQAFDEVVVQRFADQLTDDLLQSQPEAVRGFTRVEITERCRLAINAGRASGLYDRADLHGFVVLSFVLGPRFHRTKTIANFLRSTTVADGQKMSVVLDAILAIIIDRQKSRRRAPRAE